MTSETFVTLRDFAPELADSVLEKTVQMKKLIEGWKKPNMSLFNTEYRVAKRVDKIEPPASGLEFSTSATEPIVVVKEKSTPEISLYTASDYLCLLSTRGAFSAGFLNAFREVLIDINLLKVPEVIREMLIQRDEKFEVEFDLAMEISSTQAFTQDLLDDVLSGRRTPPAKKRFPVVRNMRQAGHNLRTGKSRRELELED